MKSTIKGTAAIIINATVAEVWEALTDPAIIRQYFFGTETITDWKPGHSIRFRGEWQGRLYEDKGTILDIVKHRLIKYSYWSSMSGIEDKPENYMIVTYELSGRDGNVKLQVTQENIPNENMKEQSIENWKIVLIGLRELLEDKFKPAGQ
jgi:uncharacterized protein YndB with AHSA1/START domain